MSDKLIVILAVVIVVTWIYGQTTFMVPMSDSVHLATDIYLPPDTADNPVPILLNRTPYGRDDIDEEFKDTIK